MNASILSLSSSCPMDFSFITSTVAFLLPLNVSLFLKDFPPPPGLASLSALRVALSHVSLFFGCSVGCFPCPPVISVQIESKVSVPSSTSAADVSGSSPSSLSGNCYA
ncbi:hypothetical protein MLD38_012446 [Melastoma candidum]|uniref:Uncharacterized protein n=1 Tax=Melastoma candidum TaxID=119954 RepID=A0ACB9R7F9_9MYRT|nr:hypothetical protein MLD38_012446 [Melastoma candidum]